MNPYDLNSAERLCLAAGFEAKYGDKPADEQYANPPLEFKTPVWRHVHTLIGDALDYAPSTVSRKYDLYVARYPGAGQVGWRDWDETNTFGTPRPLDTTQERVYRMLETMTRAEVWNILRTFLPPEFRTQVPHDAPGFRADDNNVRRRTKPNTV